MGSARGKITHNSATGTSYYHEPDRMASMRGGDGSFVPHNASRHGATDESYDLNADFCGTPLSAPGPYKQTEAGGIHPAARDGVDEQNGFNFNSTQPLPWRRKPRQASEEPFQLRRFAACHDPDLLAYLNSRNVSVSFLVEIDQFLHSRPEIASCAPGLSMLQSINTMAPLEAYRYFIKGYTRPARYNDGVIIPNDFRLPAGFRPPSVRTRRDPELDEFFDGFEYRWDILDRIDREVLIACAEMSAGRIVKSSMRRLVCYAIWGNPVDAYKWYEYSVQEEYLPHRYLPEHVVLNEIPKPANYTKPVPSVLDVSGKHSRVRARMARANDAGVDVLDVLLIEYRLALIYKGYRRREIDDLCSRAKHLLDIERQSPRGVDIVDMLMDDAVGRQPTRRPAVSHQAYLRAYAAPARTSRARTRRSTHARQVPDFLSTQAVELDAAKRNMERLYTMEEDAMASWTRPAHEIAALSSRRASAERRYVNAVIRYLRDSKQMSSFAASDLQRYFTRQMMHGMGPVHRVFLLGLYPRELA